MAQLRVLAIDLGTSSVRTALYDARGRRCDCTLVQRALPLRSDGSGRAELDPARVLRELRTCLDGTLTATDIPITAVGVSSFWHGLLGLDASGAPVTPIYTWADSRCAEDAAALRRRWSEREVHGRTGCMLRASFWPAKLAWLRRTEAARVSRVTRWCSPIDWLCARLNGWDPLAVATARGTANGTATATAHGMATATGLYDPKAQAWDPVMLRRCRLRREQLSPISDEPRPSGAAAIRRWPTLREAAWHPAIGDGAANNLGVGAVAAGTAAINFGTSAAVRVVRSSGEPKAPFGLFCYRIDAHRHLIGGAISNAGSLRAWGLDHLRLPEGEALERELAKRPAPDHGLTVLPCWLAERAPTWPDDLSGAVLGLRQATTAMDLFQALTEATYLRLASILDRIPAEWHGTSLRLLVGGGIQRSPSSLARLANALGRPLTISDDPESSLRGAAVLVLERLGAAAPPVLGATIRPTPALVARYRQQRFAQEALERVLSEGNTDTVPGSAGASPAPASRSKRRQPVRR